MWEGVELCALDAPWLYFTAILYHLPPSWVFRVCERPTSSISTLMCGGTRLQALVVGVSSTHSPRLGTFVNVKTHIPPFLSLLYTHTSYGAAAVEPLVQLGGDWCFASASLPKPSFVFAHDRRRRASSAHSHTRTPTCRPALMSDSAALVRLLRCRT